MADSLADRPEMGLLMVAVPLEIARVGKLTEAEWLAEAAGCAQHVTSHGDDLLFRSKAGASADAFVKLATGLACLAYAPGGVTFAGQHFEAVRPSAGGK